jgi:hypothetical protein
MLRLLSRTSKYLLETTWRLFTAFVPGNIVFE